MIRQAAALLASAAAMAMSPAPAVAQQSASAEGAFLWAFELEDMVFMVQALPQTGVLSEPVEVWSWTFYRTPEEAPRLGIRDSMAVRTRIDCASRTRAASRYEGYMRGAFTGAFDEPEYAWSSSPDTASWEIVRAACEPEYRQAMRSNPNFASARAAVRAHFAGSY